MASLLIDQPAPPVAPPADRPWHPRSSRLMPWAVAVLCAAVYAIAPGRSLDYDSSVTVGLFVRPSRWVTPLITTHDFNNHPLFSLIEWFVWHLGGQSEAALRVAPILFGAATVWVVAAWAQSHWGWPVGLAAGVVLAANPTFAVLSRDVRGYSLATLGVVVATCWLVDNIDRADPDFSPWYVIAMAVAVGTNFMCLIVLGAHAVAVVAAGHRRWRWWANLAGAAVGGLAVLAPTLGQLIALIRSQQRHFLPRFPLDVWSMLVGTAVVAGVCIGAAVLVGVAGALRHGPRPTAEVWSRLRSRPLLVAGIALAAVLGVEWLALRPPNLDPRFVVWLVPAAAIAAAVPLVGRSVAVRAAVATLLVIGVAALVIHQAPTWTLPEEPLGEAANWILFHHEGVVCADGAEAEAFTGYGLALQPLVRAADASRCEAVVQIGPPSGFGVMGAARAVLPKTVRFRGRLEDVLVHYR